MGDTGEVAEMETETMSDIELSSDSEQEEEEGDEVSLIVMKRPTKIERTVKDIEVVDPSHRSGDSATFTAQERSGQVKEYIETQGLGMIIAPDIGLVLFHLDSVWLDGKPSTNGRIAKEKLYPGSDVSFLMRSFHGEEYSRISEDSVVHQAVAVWYGNKPEGLIKTALGEENTRKLEENRKSFMLYVKGEVFIRVSLVRVRAEVAGYLTDNIGILEYEEDNSKHNILFHADDVMIFKKEVASFRGPCKKNLPVGCTVKVDARRIHIADVKNVHYQAIVVLAGSWPSVLRPTLLQGGKGSYAPGYDVPEESTFYYLELPLESKLGAKVEELKSLLKNSRGRIEYDWRDVEYIRTKDDYLDWKEQMGGEREVGRDHRRYERKGPKECLDTFKSCSMVEEEIAVKTVSRKVENRTWYTPEAWPHGGLRLKKEERLDPDEPSLVPTKKQKLMP